jgi:small redox-active disulfide protein 2
MTTIHVLGTGCAKCQTLTHNTESAAKDLGLEYELIKVTEIPAIMKYGVMSTPALVVNGKVKSQGRLLSPEQIKPLLA